MSSELTSESRMFLSMELAGPLGVRLAAIAVTISFLVFFAVAPFAKIPIGQIPAFNPIYVTVLVVCDLITAVLLFSQFNFLRLPALLILASGYFFTATTVISYALMFPGMLSPTGLLGAGPQSTSAIYMFWHAGFPLLVMAYATRKVRDATVDPPPGPRRATAWFAVLRSLAAVAALVLAFTLFVTLGRDYLPTFIDSNHTTSLGHSFLVGDWLLSLAALLILWRRQTHTVMDLWLMVVMCAWLFDVAISAVLNSGRYDLGWYVGRVYGSLAATLLLIVLLAENANHYARLARLSAKLSDANDRLEQLSLRDGLTGLSNRRSFDSYLAGQIAIARRHRRVMALVLCDVDDFKAYNDHYGHQAGDACLQQVASALQDCCRRPADMAARYGGEEFAMILPDTELNSAARIAEAAREAVALLKIPHAGSLVGPYVSISGGVAVLQRTFELGAQHLISAADKALFEAKHRGRNQIVSVSAERPAASPVAA